MRMAYLKRAISGPYKLSNDLMHGLAKVCATGKGSQRASKLALRLIALQIETVVKKINAAAEVRCKPPGNEAAHVASRVALLKLPLDMHFE